MTREEFAKKWGIKVTLKGRTLAGQDVMDECLADLDSLLPPAEDAEAYMAQYFQKKYSGAPPVTLTKPECIELMTEFAAQQQLTAEGAGEPNNEKEYPLCPTCGDTLLHLNGAVFKVHIDETNVDIIDIIYCEKSSAGSP